MNNLPLLLLFVVMLVGMFFMNRKQKQAQQERQAQMDNMKPGDELVTIGGLHGVLHEINTEKGIVTIDCDGVYLDFDRNAIRSVTSATSSVDEDVNTDSTDDSDIIQ